MGAPASTLPAFLGFGLTTPFQRDQRNDFAATGGVDLVLACVEQVLGTVAGNPQASTSGELPWRSAFGSYLYLLRHKNITDTTLALGRAYARDALARWEPRALVRSVTLVADPNTRRAVRAKVAVDVIAANVQGNAVVLAAGQSVDVVL